MYSSLSPKELSRSSCSTSSPRRYLDHATQVRCRVAVRTVNQVQTRPSLLLAISATVWLLLILLFVFALGHPAHAQHNETTLAVVNDKRISQGEVDQAIASQLLPLEQRLYALRQAALENLITRTLLEAEASRLGISVEELRKRLSTGPVSVSEKEVEEVYQENALVFAAMSPDEAREKLRLDLEAQARMQLYRKALAKLKVTAKIDVFLEEPRLPTLNVGDGAPTRGLDEAKVTITEFSDFQCPFCKEAQSAISGVLQRFPKEVRLQFKHLPLPMHPQAFSSARAAFCAGAQGKFWQYHDALFTSEVLNDEVLKNIATVLQLDLRLFDACLSSDASRAGVEKDLRDARNLGITATPSLVVNGRLIQGVMNFANLNAIVERELQSQGTPSK